MTKPVSKKPRGILVWETLPSGRRRKRRLMREHVCTKRCLRVDYMFGLPFAYCARFSYAG